jgi:hypothetical protein
MVLEIKWSCWWGRHHDACGTGLLVEQDWILSQNVQWPGNEFGQDIGGNDYKDTKLKIYCQALNGENLDVELAKCHPNFQQVSRHTEAESMPLKTLLRKIPSHR